MIRNAKIGIRLAILIAVQLAVLVIISFIGVFGLNTASTTMVRMDKFVGDQLVLNRLTNTAHTDLLSTVNGLSQGSITWEEANATLASAKEKLKNGWDQYLGSLSPDEAEVIRDVVGPTLEGIDQLFVALEPLVAARDRSRLTLLINNELRELTEPYTSALEAKLEDNGLEADQTAKKAKETINNFLLIGMVLSLIGLVIAVLFGAVIYRSIAGPIRRIADTVQQVAEGDFEVRTRLTGSDELAQLGQAFDQLLEDKVATLVRVEQENAMLNNSVIELLQAVSQLSQRDLTVKVPVTEDLTGPVADALNLLTDETSKVLMGVTQISEEVAKASNEVKAQSETVMSVAENERREVEKTAAELAVAAENMNRIAELARTCNVAAENAIKSTQTALETVTNTVNGISNTRDTIRETEKRIKRLGERSQEISGVVNLINTIAERTHILALNASMHAASAGEAGRGFAVVADEVQRLAENAREATSQIATLVSNIQAETADTVNAMNAAISQVVEGSRLAEQAGEQMKKTQQTTGELVASVQQIASRSQEQAQASNELLGRAQQIQSSTLQTNQQLREQNEHSNRLVKYARELLNSVRVFKLPTQEAS
jgi:methyl-accepting chemotaxis protein